MHIIGCRYNERLNVKTEGSKRLGYTGLFGMSARYYVYYVYYYVYDEEIKRELNRRRTYE